MSKDCQFCGTSVTLPEKGALVINRKNVHMDGEPRDLAIDYQDNDTVVFQYSSIDNLVATLELLYQKNTSNFWLHILNLESSQSFPISIHHLYERLKRPNLASIIHDGDFTSHLQPIVDMSTNEVYGYESLLRTTEQSVNPGELFSYAQRSGLQSMLDQKARRSAVKAKSEFLTKGQKIFINFLPSTIYVPEFCLKHTFQIVKEFQIDPSDLVFEVVETEKISDVDHLKRILDTYKASGMKVALDDVGSGYSTIEMLSLLKPDYLKVDRSYIQNCHENKENQEFLYQVMERADLLGIQVLAEGIETLEEWTWLNQLGVDYGQGYFIGRPKAVPEKEFSLP
ncbi:EAL domain-containing protein [Halobacillus locisalis]|uniref:EAL domain-containing protein n=1 Tax=Halobacillus locisalis TaxID=220753 RepID=A0A838CNH1_9BACI|nr:EAL domain-containing protein [Halobacillus locisalis]MBA2173285.1 EAL domain-containing protein [Halobacillus locisalis]